MGMPFSCVPAAFQQWEPRSHTFLEMNPDGRVEKWRHIPSTAVAVAVLCGKHFGSMAL